MDDGSGSRTAEIEAGRRWGDCGSAGPSPLVGAVPLAGGARREQIPVEYPAADLSAPDENCDISFLDMSPVSGPDDEEDERDRPPVENMRSNQVEEHDMPENVSEYVDWALEKAGGWGPFQKMYCVLLSLPWVVCGLQTLVHIFVTTSPRRRRICASQVDRCHHELLADSDCALPRSEYEFDAVDTSVVAEFGLVCESAMAVPLLGTLFFMGFLLGVTYFGGVADRRGRRLGYLGSLAIMQSAGLLAACAPTYPLYAAARLLIGLGVGGVGVTSYVWMSEVLGAKSRAILLVTTNTGFAVGVLFLSPLAYAIPRWRWLSLAIFLAGVPIVLAFPFLHESPTWLAGPAQRPDDAHNVLCHIAATNGQPLPPPPPLPRARTPRLGGQDVKKSESLWVLASDARLATRFRVMCIAWFALSFGYYGLSMNVANLGGSVYLSSALAAAVELPMYPIAFCFVQRAGSGRRGTTMAGLVVGGVCCMLSAFVTSSTLMLTLVYVGKAAIAASFGVVYLYAAELFPADIRGRSLGIQSLCARIGGMLAPVVADLGKASQALPVFIFGLPCVAAGLMLASLPETLGAQLPGTIEDIPPAVKRTCNTCFWRYAELQEDVAEARGPSPATIGRTRA